MRATPARSPPRRRKRLRETFDRTVDREWKRYSGESQRVLRLALRERFIQLHLKRSGKVILELGPGPGRFTPIVRNQRGSRVIAVDLSIESLRAARRRSIRRPALARIDWVQGAGEHLPLGSRSVDAAIVVGNIVSFAALDGPILLAELGRVVRPNGRLVVDFGSPAAAVQEFFHVAADRRLLSRVLRRPTHFFVDQVLKTGFQPYAPERWAVWEFQFYTVAEAASALARAGFSVIDTMSVAPIAAHSGRIASIARREKKTWDALLRIEEQVGRRSGAHEVGHGFIVAANRT
jgi:ubiquinone/menaquinone biosynthesis C-methylase UbiE